MTDYLIDENGDLLIIDGDFAVGDSDLTHQRDIIIAQKGEYKEFPEVGVGIDSLLCDENPKDVLLNIKRQLEYDGCLVRNIHLTTENKLIVDAIYQ